MRSSDTRVRNTVADGARRSLKSLKLRLAKDSLPMASTSTADRPVQSSVLCSPQVWRAAGHRQPHLTCDREIYFPDMAVSAPVVKQLADDSSSEAPLGKRQRLGTGQYRRSTKDLGSDSTGRCTAMMAALQERVNSNALATTSSGSSQQHCQQQPQQRLPPTPAVSPAAVVAAAALPAAAAAPTAGDFAAAWPMIVPSRRKRSSRRRRTLWQQWPLVLQDLISVPAGANATACLAVDDATDLMADNAEDAVRTPTAAVDQQQQHPASSRKPLSPQQPSILHLGPLQLQQQQQRWQQLHGSASLAQQDKCGDGLQSVLTTPMVPLVSSTAAAKFAAVAECNATCGDASPGQETSQSSDMTCMQDSPRGPGTAHMASWPSSSSDSDMLHDSGKGRPAATADGLQALAAAVTAACMPSMQMHLLSPASSSFSSLAEVLP